MAGWAGNGPRYGRGQRYTYTAKGGETVIGGPDDNLLTLKIVPGFEQVYLNNGLLTRADYLAGVSSITFKDPLAKGDTVDVLALGEMLANGAMRLADLGADVPNKEKFKANLGIEKKNLFVNGCMRISQQYGGAASTASNYYYADQWTASHNHNGALSIGLTAVPTPGGSSHRIRATVITADAAPPVGGYSCIRQFIEGLRLIELQWGTAQAKGVTIQFGVKAPSGTYSVCITNNGNNRNFVADYVIKPEESNTDVVKSVYIPGDTTGTWAFNTTNYGMDIKFGLLAGVNQKIPPGVWTNGVAINSTAAMNFLATVGNVFELFDVGMYEGDVAPAFKPRDYAEELAICKRYYQSLYGLVAVAPGYCPYFWTVTMRATPSVTTTISGATPQVSDPTGGYLQFNTTTSGSITGSARF